ncbi:palmitoyltransferase ZDHHC18-like [Oratosquilla oratoria]|uniref:palmitoyltransferase ZDHHC18-like n=1 Tax=Oratosquilla oratoria TaxID=337810 RepID=UPI003F7764E0
MTCTDFIIRALLLTSWILIAILLVIGQGSFWSTACPGVLLLMTLSTGLAIVSFLLLLAKDPGRGPWQRPSEDEEAYLREDGLCSVCEVEAEPFKMEHCSACNVCVQQFNHHCCLLGVCVGGKNYPYFMGTLVSSMTFHSVTAVATIIHLVAEGAGALGAVLWTHVLILLLFVFPGLQWSFLALDHLVCFCLQTEETCWGRWQRKVLSFPSPDLHTILLQREAMMLEATRNQEDDDIWSPSTDTQFEVVCEGR